MSTLSKPVQEAIKEFIRLQIFSVITATVEALGVIALGINTTDGTIIINWSVVAAIFLLNIVVTLKVGLTNAADKLLYETGKETGDETLKKGLTGGI